MEQFTGTTVGFWNTGGRRGIHILFLGEESQVPCPNTPNFGCGLYYLA